MMESEHDNAGVGTGDDAATDQRVQGPGGCLQYIPALLAGLEEVESDMHQHVHKENNILFPRAIMLESELRGR